MKTKPVTPKMHGIIDYALGAALMAAPSMLPVNKKARNTYLGVASGMTGLNSMTDTPVGIKRTVSFKDHQKADLGLLAGMALLTALPMIRKDKTTLYFHLGLLAITGLHYLLTDYNETV